MNSIPLPEYRTSINHLDIRIGSLLQEVQQYHNYPSFQREKVWSFAMKRSLIDSILRGFPIPELLATRKNHHLDIVDGQQRLTTIIEYQANGFATARLKEDPCLVPIEPNKRYTSLSPQMQENFNNYTLRISVIDDIDEQNLGALFRRLQHQQSLMIAEKLWTFTSEANRQAAELAMHPFWQQMYIGNKARKRSFLGCLYLLRLEIAGGTTNLTLPFIRELAAGALDSYIAPSLIEKMGRRLDNVERMFYRSHIQSLKEMIPVYQALLQLELADCDWSKSSEGCLSPWFAHVRQISLEARKTYGETDVLSKMIYSSYQQKFWEVELAHVREANGVCIIDRKRGFSRHDRELALERQKSVCPSCGLPITLADIGHHVILHAKGGPTTVGNCVILHERCHDRLHNLPGTQWELLKEA